MKRGMRSQKKKPGGKARFLRSLLKLLRFTAVTIYAAGVGALVSYYVTEYLTKAM